VLVDYYHDWTAAEEHYLHALQLDPGYAVAHQLYAELLRDRGRFDEALREIDEVIRLDLLARYFRLVRGIILHMARRPEDALRELEALLRAAPEYPLAHFYVGLVAAGAGRFEQALEALARVDPDGTFPDAVCVRGGILARMGRRSEAEAALRALEGIGGRHQALPFHAAGIQIGLGNLDLAVALLEQGAEQRGWFARILAVEPAFDPLRDLPRFQALVQRVMS
jgi:eukaryotic-like serine/threonine-protein kinase